MANILDLITVGEKLIYQVDADPSGGTAATIGSIAMLETAGNEGQVWLKYGALDTEWKMFTVSSTGTNVQDGNFRRLPIYVTDPSGDVLNDVLLQNSQPISVIIAAQATRSAGITYQIPNPGNAVTAADFVLTEGAQTINGDKTFGNNVIVQGDLTVNGALAYLNTTNTTIKDALITLNKGGGLLSGGGVGFEIEELVVATPTITGYFKVDTARNGFSLLPPGVSYSATLINSLLSADRTYKFPDASGTLMLQSDPVSGVVDQVAYWTSTTMIGNEVGTAPNALTWDHTNNFFGIQIAAPQSILHVGNNSTSGTVAASAVILGKLNATANVGAGALIANGSGGANTASGVDSAVFGRSCVSSGLVSLSVGLSSNADADYSFALGRRAKVNSKQGAFVLADSQDADLSSEFTNHMCVRFDNGLDLRKGDASSPNYKIRQASIPTTDATVTTLFTLAIPTDTVVLLETRVAARRTGGTGGTVGDSASYVRHVRIKNISGTVSVVKLQSSYTSEDQNGMNCIVDISGTDARVRVTGTANNDFTWQGTMIIQQL